MGVRAKLVPNTAKSGPDEGISYASLPDTPKGPTTIWRLSLSLNGYKMGSCIMVQIRIRVPLCGYSNLGQQPYDDWVLLPEGRSSSQSTSAAYDRLCGSTAGQLGGRSFAGYLQACQLVNKGVYHGLVSGTMSPDVSRNEL